MTKLDFLGECNDQKLPLEDFRLTFCVRCFQKDCTRSQFGLSRFEARISSWEDRLFKSPQLPRQDPRYAAIVAKKFLALPVGSTPSIRQEWIDPQTLDTPDPQVQSIPSPSPVEVQAPVEPPKPVRVSPPIPEVTQPEPKVTQPEPKQKQPKPNLFINTPYTGARTLENRPHPALEQPRDAWAAVPEAQKSAEGIVKPGARIKIGGSG
jgi:hypothetical protein